MKLYKTKQGIVIEKEASLHLLKDQMWDAFINDDGLYEKMEKATQNTPADPKGSALVAEEQLLAPVESQKIWVSGVTYSRSRVGRQEESNSSMACMVEVLGFTLPGTAAIPAVGPHKKVMAHLSGRRIGVDLAVGGL